MYTVFTVINRLLVLSNLNERFYVMQTVNLQELGLHFVKSCLSTYLGQVYFFGIFIFSIFMISISKRGKVKYFSSYTLFLFFTVFNPLLVKILFSCFDQDDVYYRFFWLLPVNIVVAFSFVHCITLVSTYIKKAVFTLFILCSILFLGSPVINFSSFFDLPDNLFKTPDEVLEISEYIHQDTAPELLHPNVAADPNLLLLLRQYDASLLLTLERDRALCWQGAPSFQNLTDDYWYQMQKPIMDTIYGGDTSNSDAFLDSIISTNTQYIVFSKTINIQDFLLSLGGRYVAETNNYMIFRIH